MQQNDLRQLSAMQSVFFIAGGVFMVAGMGCYVFMFDRHPASLIASLVYLAGSVAFAVLQCMQTYHGDDFTVRRLKNIMNMADLLFVLAGILMTDTCTQFLRPMFHNMKIYYDYIYNKWLILLLIAVILELYSVNRMSRELKKRNGKK